MTITIQDLQLLDNYKDAFYLMMDYWDCIPDDEKQRLSDKLDELMMGHITCNR